MMREVAVQLSDDIYAAALPLRSFAACRAGRRRFESLWLRKGSEGDIYTPHCERAGTRDVVHTYIRVQGVRTRIHQVNR